MTLSAAVIGTPGRLAGSFLSGTSKLFERCGHNTGNLAFQHAVWSSFINEKRAYSFNFAPEEVRERHQLVCLPAANFLYSGFDLGGLADRLEATQLPIMTLGLGAQAFKSIDEVRLKDGTIRLLRLLSERGTSIMVRGSRTAAVLEKYGVQNFDVLGCPSNFINGDVDLGKKIALRWEGAKERLAFAPTFYSYNSDFELKIYSDFSDRVREIIAQDPIEAIALARGDLGPELTAWWTTKSGFISQLEPDARAIALTKMRTFFDAEAWLEAYRGVDAVIGSRIHGVNLGWQAGRAAMVVSYDLRTAELAETMGIPWITAQVSREISVEHVLDQKVAEAASAYDTKRATLAARYADLLRAHGTIPSDRILRLAEPAVEQGRSDFPAEGIAADDAGGKRQVWGFLEQYNRSRIAGWVASSDGTPPRVRLSLGDVELGVVAAETARPDLGTQAWGFEFRLDASQLSSDVMRVSAVLEETGQHLGNSPVVQSFAGDDHTKVLVGRDGWLFLQNDSNSVLDQITGKRPLSVAELSAWARFFKRVDTDAAMVGSKVIYLVAPNKECVYSQYLPGISLSENRAVLQLRTLVADLMLRNTTFVYPLEILSKLSERSTYAKGDTHWTDYGALLALSEVVAAAAGSLGNPPLEPVAADFKSRYVHADLLSKLGGTCVEPQALYTAKPKVLILEDNRQVNTGRRLLVRSNQAAQAGKLLFIHDSFGDWLLPYLAARSSEVATIWGSGVDSQTIAALKPNVVLFERAERFLIAPPA